MRIALSGLKRSGKDTIGEHLVSKYGFYRYAFADKLKEVAKELFPEEFKKTDKPVELLQWLGDKMRERDPKVWVKYVVRQIGEERGPEDNIVVTDVRYPNEVSILKELGFIVVRVHAPIETIISRCVATEKDFKPELLNHSSEKMAMEENNYAHYTIRNISTLEELNQRVDVLVSMLKRIGL